MLQGRADYPDAAFDALFLFETIEHLSESPPQGNFDGGQSLAPARWSIDCDNTEQRSARRQHGPLPDCGAIFHRWQHMRSFDIDTLGGLLGTYAFNQRLCIGSISGISKPPSRRWLRRFRLWVARLAEPPNGRQFGLHRCESVE